LTPRGTTRPRLDRGIPLLSLNEAKDPFFPATTSTDDQLHLALLTRGFVGWSYLVTDVPEVPGLGDDLALFVAFDALHVVELVATLTGYAARLLDVFALAFGYHAWPARKIGAS